MRKTSSALAVAMMVFAGGVLVAGCGGGSSTSGGDVASGTEAEGGKEKAPAGPGGSASTEEATGGGESTDGSGKSSSHAEMGGGSGSEQTPNAGRPSGGGESSTAEGRAPMSGARTDFVAEASSVCRKRRRRMRAQVSSIYTHAQGKDPKSQQAALHRLATDAIAPGVEAEVEELRKLEAPKGDKGKVKALLAALEAVAAEARRDPTAFLGDPAAFDEPRKLAHKSGIDACGTLS